jgi:hypothetical protein
MVNQSLEEVRHPETRARLTGIQEVVLDFDQEVQNTERLIIEKKGVGSSTATIAQRLLQECAAINKKIDDGVVTVEEGRIRMDQAKRMVEVVRSVEMDSRRELSILQGRVSGLKAAADLASKRFNDTALKYERHERMEQEERELRGEPEPTLTPEPVPPATLFEGKVKLGAGKVKRKKVK